MSSAARGCVREVQMCTPEVTSAVCARGLQQGVQALAGAVESVSAHQTAHAGRLRARVRTCVHSQLQLTVGLCKRGEDVACVWTELGFIMFFTQSVA